MQNAGMETVLVVDDEATIPDVVVQYLRRERFATLEAGDGDAARELLEREWPNLVVLDPMLPGTGGLALCRWIRGRSQLPVIMLTRGERRRIRNSIASPRADANSALENF